MFSHPRLLSLKALSSWLLRTDLESGLPAGFGTNPPYTIFLPRYPSTWPWQFVWFHLSATVLWHVWVIGPAQNLSLVASYDMMEGALAVLSLVHIWATTKGAYRISIRKKCTWTSLYLTMEYELGQFNSNEPGRI